MSIARTQHYGNPFMGLFAKACDKAALMPVNSLDKHLHAAKSFGVPVHQVSVDGSPYVGLYFAMNSRCIVAPPFLNKGEMAAIQSIGLEVLVMPDSKFSAVGNNLVCNDKGALVNPEMGEKEAKMLADALDVEVVRTALAGYKTVGMACVATNKGWLAHNRIEEGEAERLTSLFGVEGLNGTVNSGTALVGLGVVANSTGAILGERCSGFEEARIMQALGLDG